MILFGEGEKSIAVLIIYRLTYPNKTATKKCLSLHTSVYQVILTFSISIENNDTITPQP